jgi:hypothetical protein
MFGVSYHAERSATDILGNRSNEVDIDPYRWVIVFLVSQPVLHLLAHSSERFP